MSSAIGSVNIEQGMMGFILFFLSVFLVEMYLMHFDPYPLKPNVI